MVKRTEITRSDDALSVHVKGNKKHPEPTLHVIQFPGGHIEVSRCSNGTEYWAHIHLHANTDVVDSRIGYTYSGGMKAEAMGIPAIHEMPLQSDITQIAVKVKGPYSDHIIKEGEL